jgi:hypothetical protein
MLENAYHQTGMSTMGRIAAVDLANGTLTLDTGYQFKLAPNFEFTSAPALGQDVQVIYDEQGGQKVAHDIEIGGTNSHNNAGGNEAGVRHPAGMTHLGWIHGDTGGPCAVCAGGRWLQEPRSCSNPPSGA